MSCPIRIAINEIRLVKPNRSIVKIGGEECVCDNGTYHMTQRKIKYARAKAAGNFEPPNGTFADRYNEIMSTCISVEYSRIIEAIATAEDLILRKLYANGANISLPTLTVIGGDSPADLHRDINNIVNYINKLFIGVRSLLKDASHVDSFESFGLPAINMDTLLTEQNIEQIELYCIEVEKYRCLAIAHLEKIFHACSEISIN